MDTQGFIEVLTAITSLLKLTYEGTKNEERKRAEAQLQEYFNRSPIFMECLLTIIGTPDMDEKVKESACFYLTICVKQMISRKSSFQAEEASNINLHIISLLNNADITQKNKKNLTNLLSLILNMDNSQAIKQQLYVSMIRSFSNAQNRDEITGGCFIIQSLLNGTTDSLRSAKLFIDMAPFIIDTTSKVILYLFENFKDVISSRDLPPQENLASLQKNLNLLEILCNTIRLFFLKFKEYKGNLLQNIVLNDHLPILFWQILTLQCFNENQTKDCIISNSKIKPVDNSLNEIKARILRCYTIAATFIHNSSSDQNLEKTQFYLLLDKFVPIFMHSLNIFMKNYYDSLDDIFENLDLAHIVVESMNFLACCGKQSSLYHLFADSKNRLIIEVILPLLVCNKKEIQSFDGSPEEFVSLALDTCEKQTFETPKTASAHLLEILCDHVDGALSFLVCATCQIIDFSLENTSFEEFTLKNPFLKEFGNASFLNKTPPILRADSCLVSMCILSYLIPRRYDLIETIESMIIRNIGFLFSTDNGILQSRLCLFISYFSDSLFKKPETHNYYRGMLEYIINSIKNTAVEKRALSLQALESLNNLFEDDSGNYRIEPLIPVLFKEFVILIPIMVNNQFFDLLSETIRNYSTIIAGNEEAITLCIENLIGSVLEELANAGEKSKKNSLLVIKYLNCIKSLVEQKEIIKLHWLAINQRLLSLYQLLDNNNKVGIGEYVLSILSCELKSLQKVTPVHLEIFIFFTKIFEKNECTFGNLFMTLNYFILYGGEEMRLEPRCIEILIIMGTEALMSKSPLANEASNAEGCILLHLVIQKFHEVLSKEQIEKTIKQVWLRLTEGDPPKKFLQSRLKLVFVNLFLYLYNITEGIMIAYNILNPVFDKILEAPGQFSHIYERKLVVIGLSSVLSKGFQAPMSAHSPRLKGILFVILSVLQNQLRTEGREKDKKKRVLINNEKDDSENDDIFDSDEEDEGDDSDDNYDPDKDNEEEEAKINLNLLNSVIKTIDEFEYFQQVINDIRGKDLVSLQRLLDSLDQGAQLILKEILSSQRVKVNLVGNTTSVVRKIVKVKRK